MWPLSTVLQGLFLFGTQESFRLLLKENIFCNVLMYRHAYVLDKMIGAMLTVTNEAGALFFNSGSNSMPTIYCKYNFTDECT